MNTHAIAGLFIVVIIILCCKCCHCDAKRAHLYWRRSDLSNQCDALYRKHVCKPEYVQIRARLYLFCNNFLDSSFVNDYPCLRHENGTLCKELIERYFAATDHSYNPDSNRSCSYSECREECSVILQQLKDTWGCCFHELAKDYRYSLQRFRVEDSYRSYWRLCGIQPPETCPYDISPMVTDPVECTSREQFGHLYNDYYCAPLPRFLNEAKSCVSLFADLSEVCAIKDGKYCAELYYSNHTENFKKANRECPDTRDVCTVSCKTPLQSLRDHFGCCLHLENGTDPYITFYRYGLWRSCGIEPPGQCSSIITQLQSGSGFPVVSLSSIAFLIITLFLQ